MESAVLSSTAVTWLITFALIGVIGAAAMHAMVAAFEQLPHARERELAQALRPDGKPTRAARLSAAPTEAANSASLVYGIAEAGAMVSWSLLAWHIGTALDFANWVTVFLAFAVAAALALVVIRAIPRVVGRRSPEPTIRTLAPFAWLLIALSRPLRALLPALQAPELAEAEDLVERAQDALEDEDAQLLRGVVTLGTTFTRELMVPRMDMVTMQAGSTIRKAMIMFLRSGFSRVPVIGEDTDDIRGVLYLKDVLRTSWDRPDRLEDTVDQLVREPVYVPESLPADDLLRRMQSDVFHMAIVVDEYGGVAGLVTIEDALEEIVGEVVDEHDRVAPEPEDLGGGRFRVPARMALDELGELFGTEIEDDDVETVAGLLTKALGRVPILGAQATTHGLRITADRTAGRRRRLTWYLVERAPDEDLEVPVTANNGDSEDDSGSK